MSHQKISETQGNFSAAMDDADEFGGAVAGLGDSRWSRAERRALAVGAIGDDDGGTNRGAVYILFLNAAGNVLSYQKISDTQGGFTATLLDADEFGSASPTWAISTAPDPAWPRSRSARSATTTAG